MKKCKYCGSEMSDEATVCAACGRKEKKVWYKRVSFWIITVLIVFGLVGCLASTDSNSNCPPSQTGSASTEMENDNSTIDAELPIEYREVNIKDLFDTLNENALKAETEYQNQYIKVSGTISNIDSDGDYISIGCGDNPSYFLDSILCDITEESQLDTILNKSVGDQVVICGEITSIGEVLGYSMDIHSIE